MDFTYNIPSEYSRGNSTARIEPPLNEQRGARNATRVPFGMETMRDTINRLFPGVTPSADIARPIRNPSIQNSSATSQIPPLPPGMGLHNLLPPAPLALPAPVQQQTFATFSRAELNRRIEAEQSRASTITSHQPVIPSHTSHSAARILSVGPPRTFAEVQEQHLSAKAFLDIMLSDGRMNDDLYSTVTYVTASSSYSAKRDALDPQIFGWLQVDDIREAILTASHHSDEVHLFGLETLFNGGVITNEGVCPPNCAMQLTEGIAQRGAVAQRTNPALFEAVNTSLANGGFNGFLPILTEDLFHVVQNGFLTPENVGEEARLLALLQEKWQEIEQPCISSYPTGGGEEAVYLMLGSTIALGQFKKFTSSDALRSKTIQYWVALANYRAQFNELLTLALENPGKTVVYHAFPIGIYCLGNDPEPIGCAFKDAADSFQQEFKRALEHTPTLKVQVIFEVTSKEELECAQKAGLHPREPIQVEDLQEAKNTPDEVEEVEKLLHREYLSLLSTFFRGPLGERYCIQTNAFQKPRGALYLGAKENDPSTLVAWMQIKTTSQLSSSGLREKQKEHILNFQPIDHYDSQSPREILEIQINEKGNFISLHVNGVRAPLSLLLEEDSPWRAGLLKARLFFLANNALRYEPRGSIEIHPLVIDLNPELVLKIFETVSANAMPSVSFLDSRLTRGPGSDAGGLRRYLLASLIRSLFDGSHSRTLDIENHSKTPRVMLPVQPEAADLLFHLAKILSLCFQQPDYVTGRMFHDSYFELLKNLVEKKQVTEAIIVNLAKIIAPEDHLVLWGVFSPAATLPLPADMQEVIQNLHLLDELENPSIVDIRDKIREFLLETYGGCITAAHMVAYKLSNPLKAALKSSFAREISEKIQGLPFDREDIASRIRSYSRDDVVNEKAEWLKEFIREQSRGWVEELLLTVTGQSTVTAETVISISSCTGITCAAHTCSSTLDIPNTHTDHGTDATENPDNKTKFFNNLTLTMSQTGFDMA